MRCSPPSTGLWEAPTAIPGLVLLELYDLRSDPGEREDRFAGAPEGQMRAAELAEWWTTTRAPPAVAGRDPHLFQKLRQLGYVQ